MEKKISKKSILIGLFFCNLASVNAEEANDEVQDMSDPLAVYTQAGAGYTDKGLNFKVGKSYDSGQENVMAMNVMEIKGIYGDTLGYRDNLTNSPDSLRIRNFKVNTKTGLGSQIDIEYNLNSNSGTASYAFLQALPKMGRFQFYPLAGVGLAFANNVNDHPLWGDEDAPSGYSIPGVYAVVGMFSRIGLTKKIWLNYNPFWLTSIDGSETYKNNTYGIGNKSILTHELSLSYQINPKMNIRYIGNWTDETNFSDGDQRIEFNYQL